MTIQNLISIIKQRPGMFVEDNRLDYIKYFINGFYFQLSNSNCLTPIDEYFKNNFDDWVKSWIMDNRGINININVSWYSQIILITSGNDMALNLFFQLVNEFFSEFKDV